MQHYPPRFYIVVINILGKILEIYIKVFYMSVGIMSDFPFFKIFCVFSTMSICGFYNGKKDTCFFVLEELVKQVTAI